MRKETSQKKPGRFSLAHELYNHYFDEDLQSSISFINFNDKDINERNANQFASLLLMPPSTFNNFIHKIKPDGIRININGIIETEQYFGVSRQALLYRLIGDKILTHNEAQNYRNNVIRLANVLGYDDSLYRSHKK